MAWLRTVTVSYGYMEIRLRDDGPALRSPAAGRTLSAGPRSRVGPGRGQRVNAILTGDHRFWLVDLKPNHTDSTPLSSAAFEEMLSMSSTVF